MIIIAGGDSFVYGSELQDSERSYSRNTFLALLSAGHDYNCVAWPGYGNDSIARTVIAECHRHKNHCAVVVMWTFPGRYEFRFNYDTAQKKSPWYSFNSWTIEDQFDNIKKQFRLQDDSTIRAQLETINRAKNSGIVEFAKTFFKHVGSSEYWEIYSTFKEIIYLQNYLKVNSVPYMFMCADNSILYNYTIHNSDEFIVGLYQQIDIDNWVWFPPGTGVDQTQTPRGFYQWAIENKYPMGTTHPLEQAHKDAATLLKGKFDELVKKSLEQNSIRDQVPPQAQRSTQT